MNQEFCFRNQDRTHAGHIWEKYSAAEGKTRVTENEANIGMDQSWLLSTAFSTEAISSPRTEEWKNTMHPLLGSPFEQRFETSFTPDSSPLPCTDAWDSIYAVNNPTIQSNSYYPPGEDNKLRLPTVSQSLLFDDVYVFEPHASSILSAEEPPLQTYYSEYSNMHYDESFERMHEHDPEYLRSSAIQPSTRTSPCPDSSMDSITNELDLIVAEYLDSLAASNGVEMDFQESPYAGLSSPSETSTLLPLHIANSDSDPSDMTSTPTVKIEGKPLKISPPFINCVVSKKRNVSYMQAFKEFSDKEEALNIPLDIKELQYCYPYATFCNGRVPCDNVDLVDRITCALCESLLGGYF